jgi:hypothetical protein
MCLLAFAASLIAGRRSVGLGFGTVLTVAYFFGIARARVPDGFSYFMLDSAVLGLYLTQLSPSSRTERPARAMKWLRTLAGWPIIVFFVPMQHPLVQLVGLRAAIFFLPFVFLGAKAKESDLDLIARFIAVLNLVSLAFAGLEYQMGIQVFYPRNAATELIYMSHDLAGSLHRIPATFTSAHAYGGTMAAGLPFLLNRWQSKMVPTPERALMASAVLAGGIGTFMSGARLPVVIFVLLLAAMSLSLRLSVRTRVGLVAIGLALAYVVGQSERLQRFTTLSDTEYVAARVGYSANSGVIEMLLDHPLGGGLGSAWGTSMPYFLKGYYGEQIGAENEFARIALEQSLIGLLLWLYFIATTLRRRASSVSPQWKLGTRLARVYVALAWGTGFIGTGLLAAVPGAAIVLFFMGLLNRDEPTTRIATKTSARPVAPGRSPPRAEALSHK